MNRKTINNSGELERSTSDNIREGKVLPKGRIDLSNDFEGRESAMSDIGHGSKRAPGFISNNNLDLSSKNL